MAGPVKLPERAHRRVPIQCDLTSYLVSADTREAIRCMGTDASREGLGIVSFCELQPGQEVIFQIQERGIILNVIWCKKDSTRENIFHIGLKTNDIAVNLVALLQSAGLVAQQNSNESSEKSPRQKQQGATSVNVSFTDLKDVISKLHTFDQKILRAGPLEKLAASHKAFPIHHKGTSLVVVLPNALRPTDVGKLAESDAAEKIFILQKFGSPTERVRWKKVWPA